MLELPIEGTQRFTFRSDIHFNEFQRWPGRLSKGRSSVKLDTQAGCSKITLQCMFMRFILELLNLIICKQFCISCCRILLLLRNMFQQTLGLIHQLYSEILFTNFFSTKVYIPTPKTQLEISQKSLFFNPILQDGAAGQDHCRLKNWKIALPGSLAQMHLIINFWWS